jgi:hypothetical protein
LPASAKKSDPANAGPPFEDGERFAPAFASSIAFSSEVDAGSREENASKQKIRASVLIQSEPERH